MEFVFPFLAAFMYIETRPKHTIAFIGGARRCTQALYRQYFVPRINSLVDAGRREDTFEFIIAANAEARFKRGLVMHAQEHLSLLRADPRVTRVVVYDVLGHDCRTDKGFELKNVYGTYKNCEDAALQCADISYDEWVLPSIVETRKRQ
jgi:hypothetical protein